MEDRQKTCPMYVKLTSFVFVVSVKQFRFRSLMPPVWLNSACNCWTVSCISLQSAGCLLLCQEYRRRYSPKWLSTLSMIWQIIIDFLKLLSDRYQSRCHRRLPNLNVPYFDTECKSSLYICQPQTWSHQDFQALCILDGHLPFGAAPPGFQPGLAAWRNSLSSIPPTFPFTVCKPWF